MLRQSGSPGSPIRRAGELSQPRRASGQLSSRRSCEFLLRRLVDESAGICAALRHVGEVGQMVDPAPEVLEPDSCSARDAPAHSVMPVHSSGP